MKMQDRSRNIIMVAGEDPISLETVTGMLQDEGYTVRSAGDDCNCLEFARKVDPDLILIDTDRQVSDAIDNCRRFKSDPELEAVPILFLVSNSQCSALEDLYRAGAGDFIRKPLNRIELLSRIDLLLELRRTMIKSAEAEMLKGNLARAGNVCHTLNQPLQYILGAVQILLMDMSPEDMKYKSLDTIREKIEQMGGITRKLAEVTRYHAESESNEH